MFLKGKSKLPENLYFIDNHTHGAYGINFNYANYNEIKFLLKELYKRNIKGICPTLVGETNENIQKQLQLFKKIKQEQLNNIQNECLILGVHLEGSFLSPQKAGIQDKTVFLKPTIENFKNLVGNFEDIIKIITIAPEEDINLINYLNEKNIKTQAGHTIGDNLKGCIATTHHFNAMNSIHHRNSSIALSGLIQDEIYIEGIFDLIHLSKDIIKLILKTKPKNRIILISDSLPCAHSNKDIIFCNKKINQQGKDINGTLAGSNKTLDEICYELINQKILDTKDIAIMAFKNQIEYLNLSNEEINILNR